MILSDPTLASRMPAPAPEFADEDKRLGVLRSFQPDALEDDPELCAIVQFAAKLCDTPVSQVTLVDDLRQNFLAREGIDERSTPREHSFCAHTMLRPEMLEVRDTVDDVLFCENIFVKGEPGVRFYAGQPLVSEEGAPLGALCVVDLAPRPEGLSPLQREGLSVLAQSVMRRLNSKRADLRAQSAIAEREERLRRMIEGVPQIAWSADAKGNFDYFNARWAEITGKPPPKVAEEWRPFIHPEDAEEIFDRWRRAFANGENFEGEYRLLHKDGSWAWVLGQAAPVAEREGDTVRWFGTITDIDASHKALEARDMLANELSHRIKNIFAVVIGLATLKAGKAPEHKPFVRELVDILHALNRAHDFVRPSGGQVQESLQGLLSALFAPYRDGSGQPRVRLAGADMSVSASAATPLALVFHELATNSAKYGALSVSGGHVDLAISQNGDAIHLSWSEHGGPPVSAKGNEGFGSRLIEASVRGQLRGSWDRRFEEDGLVMRMTVSKEAISAAD